jgi:EF-P beta-lysylation protein EpmB
MSQETGWRKIQRQNFTDCKKLLAFLEFDEKNSEQVLLRSKFPLNVPLRLAKKMAKNSLQDPLVRQFLPLKEEEVITPNFCDDPVKDRDFRKGNRLLHKYTGRALLLTTAACVMNCRFCFRRHFDYQEELDFFHEELQEIEKDTSLSEIILSGGDPLSLSDEKLDHLLQKLSAIPHLKRLRFHTRFPIGIPERIDDSFLALLKRCRLQVVFVIHCNHPNELDQDILDALKKIQALGIPLLNQNVLLKDINDDPATLKNLMELLSNNGILPYQLHQLDKVQGAAHFEVEEKKGLKLHKTLAQSLSGYALPRYVKEVPGNPHKTPVG